MKIVRRSDEKRVYFADLATLDIFELYGLDGTDTLFIKVNSNQTQNTIGLQSKTAYSFKGADPVNLKKTTLTIED